MSDTPILKIGYYSIYETKTSKGTKFTVDSGKTIYLPKYKKYIINSYRDVKDFDTITKAKEYVNKKLKKGSKEKEKKISKLPKSLYLVLIKEEQSGITFVKVGFTSKKFIMRRFSKIYGYEGYVLETILRRVDTPHAEKLETEIKEKLKKKKSVQKYRPLLKTFSGYSECFDYSCLIDIVSIFDESVKTY
jgi:hypothetical protein